MGELITRARPYFRWVSAYHRATDPAQKLRILRNELTLLNATEQDPAIKRALGRVVSPQPQSERIPNATLPGPVI